jgi:hypothetical protein
MQEFLTIFALLLAYGAFHSLLAANGVKVFFLNRIGKRAYLGLYRLFYNIIATLSLVPILAIVAIDPGNAIWEIDAPLSYLLIAFQLIGLIGLTVSLLQIDGLRFLGLRQAAAWLNGDQLPLPEEPLQRGGVYALVRHPLYLFSLLFIWPNTTMTAALLGFNIGITVYFVLGSLLEEQKLRQAFGITYEQYQAEVPWLIPFLKHNRVTKPLPEQMPE